MADTIDAVDSLWVDAVPIEDTEVADFENRSTTCTLYDSHGTYQHVIETVGADYQLSNNKLCDLWLRVYLAHCADSGVFDVRQVIEQTRLIPPKGWVQSHRSTLPTVDTAIVRRRIQTSSKRQYTFGTSPSVYEMVQAMVNGHERYDHLSDAYHHALTFAYDGYEDCVDERGLLDDRPTTD